MAFTDESEVIAFIKKNRTVSPWVIAARKNHKILKALVTGEGFLDLLIEKIEKIESTARQEARKKYSKDIRDLFDRVMQPRINVFSASGGSVNNQIKSDSHRKELKKVLEKFKGQKSIHQYLAENYFQLADIDPNGIMFMEYIQSEDIFPTYKSIDDIRWYHSDGQLIDVIIFEPRKLKVPGRELMEWRVVDENKDWRVLQDGETFTFLELKTFDHPFGIVPATILSPKQKTGSELRISNLEPIIPLSEDYARDKSILNIYKFQHGFPRHGKYEQKCKACHGAGKVGNPGEKCGSCKGSGTISSQDVTDIQILQMPEDKDAPLLAPNLEWFVSPDLETWGQYNTDQRESEDKIDSTMWGTKRITNATNETATGRFIDVQPVMNKLSMFSKEVQWTHNQLVSYVISWINGQPETEVVYHFSYGTRFIIESPDVILDKYVASRDKGANTTVLDKLLDEYILAKNQNSPTQLEIAQKKRQVEPYIHMSTSEVNDFYGAVESFKKVLFVEFWEQADTTKDVPTLSKEFTAFTEEHKLNNQTSTND